MSKLKLRKYIWSIFLFILGLILLLIGHIRWALLLITVSFAGIILRVYISKKKIKVLSKEWNDMTFLILTSAVIIIEYIRYLAFDKKFNLLEILAGIIFLIIFYIYFRFIIPKLVPKMANKKRKN